MYIYGTASNRFVRAIRNQAGGVTYVAMPGAVVGDSDEIRGERIHIVSNQQLRQIIRATPFKAPFLCTSFVTDMSGLFKGLTNFNMPIGHWDTSRVTNMEEMFFSASSFGPGQQIGDWDVGRVADMSYMFYNAQSFNRPINRWNVSNVIYMDEMFAHAESFDQPIGDWDVGNVMSMSGMFYHAKSFNQPINRWDVSDVLNMSEMFYSAYSFNQPIDNWNVAHVTTMNEMFMVAKSFKQPGIAKWDRLLRTPLSRVYGMFRDAPLAEAAYKAGVAAEEGHDKLIRAFTSRRYRLHPSANAIDPVMMNRVPLNDARVIAGDVVTRGKNAQIRIRHIFHKDTIDALAKYGGGTLRHPSTRAVFLPRHVVPLRDVLHANDAAIYNRVGINERTVEDVRKNAKKAKDKRNAKKAKNKKNAR
jgi:surface protein